MEITIEDVKLAVKVIREFLKLSREAERTLMLLGRRYSRTGGFRPPSFEDVFQMVMAEQMRRRGEIPLEEIEEELTPEELERFRKIAQKVKEK